MQLLYSESELPTHADTDIIAAMSEATDQPSSIEPAVPRISAGRASFGHGLLAWLPVLLGLVAFAAGFLSNDAPAFVQLPAWVCGLMFCYVISMVLHELGHFVVGLLVGIPIAQVIFGSREPFFEFSVGSVKWSFRAFPFGGMVVPTASAAKWREILMTAAGPLVNLTLILACGWILWAKPELLEQLDATGSGESFLWGMVLVTTMGFLQTAIPRNYKFEGRMHLNDAGIILGLLRNETRFETVASWDDVPVEERRAWLDGYRQCISATEATAAEPRQWLEVFVTAALMWGISEHMGEAEEYSRRLLQFAPSDLSVQGIRGGVLVEIGRVDEGMALLETVMANSNDPHDRGIFACFVALGKKKSGDLEEGRRWAARAREIDPNGPALPRIRDLLDGGQPGAPATSGERT